MRGRGDSLFVAVLLGLFLALALFRLGSREVPETYWEPDEAGESVLVDLGSVFSIGRVAYFSALPRDGVYALAYSEDAVTWKEAQEIRPKEVFRWEHVDGPFRARYIKITAQRPGGMIGELVFFEAGSLRPLPVVSCTPLGEALFDEQHTAQFEHSYLTGTYFDEIYHARTAFEHLHRLPPYEWTHPPLGKLIIALGVALFGMNPFGWRIMGVVFGTLLVPSVFALARLFVQKQYALFATALFTFDFMHFVQARIATVDTYVVLFVVLAYLFLFRYFEEKRLSLLFLSGLFFGLGAATKWTAVYAGGGMALLFFLEHLRAIRKGALSWSALWRQILPFSAFSFVLIPALLYVLAYIPYLLVPGYTFRDVLRLQVSMYRYHHDLKATHPFASPWWEWPIMARPIWLYRGEGLPEGYVSSIVSFGNPILWWLGGITVLFALVTPAFLKKRGVLWILVAFFSQYVPWMLVPRITFIYHYYGCVPFLAVLLSAFFAWVEEESPKVGLLRWAFLFGAVGLFVLFYPVLSGFPVSRAYVAKFLRWFPSWVFFSGGE